jgi:hypothetical protein
MNAGVIAGLIAAKVMKNEVERIYEPPSSSSGDLVVSVGSFKVCETGVTADLKSPLSLLSRHYRWKWVPPGIAALRLITMGEGNCAFWVYNHMTENQKDTLEDKFGEIRWTQEEEVLYMDHDSDFIEAIEEIWDWMPSLVSKCPYQSVAHDMAMVRRLDLASLDKYVMSHLL